jgi:hypothetical protein
MTSWVRSDRQSLRRYASDSPPQIPKGSYWDCSRIKLRSISHLWFLILVNIFLFIFEYLFYHDHVLGYLRVVFYLGFERQEVIYPEKHFGLGQYHDVRLSRKDGGATLVLQVIEIHPFVLKYELIEVFFRSIIKIRTKNISILKPRPTPSSKISNTYTSDVTNP